MKTCKDCKHLTFETLSDMTFDYNRPLCMYYKLDTRMSQKACEHFEEKEIRVCENAKRQVKVIHCRAVGKAFGNLTDGSVHDIIAQPQDEEDSRGEWVMGVGEPVLLLYGEFRYINN